MKFTRLNENVIRCVITKEEMFDYGIEISEIVDNREKAEDFLRRVMQEARYELDYKTQGGALSVQIAVLPEGDVAMTIAETLPEKLESQMNLLKQYLEEFQKILEQKVEEAKAAEQEQQGNVVGSFISIEEGFWLRMKSMDACITAAEVLDDAIIKASSLYSYKDEYYFRLEIDDNSDGKVGRLFLKLCEYSEEIFLDHEGAAIIFEHGRCILPEAAIPTLRQL